MKLKSHLALSTIATTSTIVIVVTTAIFFLLQNIYHDGLRARGIELGKVIVHNDQVIEAVKDSNQGKPTSLNHYIESLRAQTGASFIVVVNKQAYRLSHPNPARVGKHFVGDDIYRALNSGVSYSTVAKGSLGSAIRNFVPVISNGEVIGAVCIGYLSDKSFAIMLAQYGHIGLMIAIVYLIAISMTIVLFWKMKRTFLDYEPEYIVNQFHEHELILNSIRDAIIAVDNKLNVTTMNNSAVNLFSLSTVGHSQQLYKPLATFSTSLAHMVLEANSRFHQGEFSVGNLCYRANVYPLQSQNQHTGYVVVFFPNLDHSQMERELLYLKNYAELLRHKTHEYSNKLNTLSGMLQLEHTQEAIAFIQQETDHYQSVINAIVRTVHNPAVAGLLLAKFNKASDMHVNFVLDTDTTLDDYGKTVSDKLVTIIGNLVDNALFAAWENRTQQTPNVQLYLSDRSQHVIIEVQDSGVGVPESINERIIEYGVSTKQDEEQHGVGLYLVNQLVDYFSGTLDWERTEENTTLFMIYLDKNKLMQYD
ncbi:ATP-binding protein [Vibrio palustris]|uniref:Sensor histidine kinase DpiB n=1 Tax=Vibrio palustris TaxID=1918946 RepID=A0A1R4B6W2_9VIBR|nr:sensor histidine kinase [Vibrio palustris]SJL84663.1 Sensor histidine kinase DpiB [Vibrio palustris]